MSRTGPVVPLALISTLLTGGHEPKITCSSARAADNTQICIDVFAADHTGPAGGGSTTSPQVSHAAAPLALVAALGQTSALAAWGLGTSTIAASMWVLRLG